MAPDSSRTTAPVERPLDDRHVVLVGLMGAGKSTVGPLLADRLGRSFIDLDDAVAAAEGVPVAELLTRFGELAFRRAESAALKDALDGQPVVLATGGGAVLHPDNRQLLTAGAPGGLPPVVVWLTAPVDTLVERVGPDAATRRPLLADGGTESVLTRLDDERRALYDEVATVTVDTAGATPDEVASWVLAAMVVATVAP
jgi:shikimate kinase